MRCPRCHREVAQRPAFCPACGVPLVLGEEPAPRKLDESIDIDRRAAEPSKAEPAPSVPPPVPRSERPEAPLQSVLSARPEPVAPPRAEAAPASRGAPAAPRNEAAQAARTAPAPAPRAEPAPPQREEIPPAGRAEPAPPPRKVIPPAGRAEPAPPPRKEIPPAARAEPAPPPREVIPPAGRAEPAPPPRKEVPPAGRAEPAPPRREEIHPAEPGPAVSALERSYWDIGATHRPAGGVAPAATGPVEMGSPRTVGPAAARERSRSAPGGAREIHLRRPEEWRRAAAWGIDAGPFLVGAVALARAFVREAGAGAASGLGLLDLLDLVARERVIVLSVAAAAVLAFLVYATLAHALAGATLGKRLVGLRVVTADGARPTMGRSAARSALAALSGALLGLGLLLALFTRSGRALHDLLARTWVVEVP